MSQTSDGYAERFVHQALNRRVVAEIQNVIKRCKRTEISRHLHTHTDHEAIATWRLDLNNILHDFNVRSLAFVRPSLTPRFQMEFKIHTHAANSDIRHDVVNTHPIAPDVRHDILNPHVIVHNIHRNTSKNRESTPRVSAFCTLPVTE